MNQNEYPLYDHDYEDHILTRVEEMNDGYGWSVSMGSLGYSIPKPSPVEPKVGDKVRIYGQFGRPVRGVYLNGVKVFYRTVAEQDKLNKEQAEQRSREKKQQWEKNKDEYFAKIAALPEIFQRRIKKFQDTNPDYDWEFGGYELFCCEQAWVFVTNFGTSERLLEWSKLGYEEQKKQLPELSDGHSGNTFGFAVRLAYHYLTERENVVREHGSMTPLVGCAEFGCPHTEKN